MDGKTKRQELYMAAVEVFAQYGYKKATVEDIAEKIGLTKSAIYQYVKSKNDLFEEALRYQMHEWHCEVVNFLDMEGDFKLQFAELCRRAFKYLNSNKFFKKILAEDSTVFPMSFDKDPYRDIHDKSLESLEKFIEIGVQQGALRNINPQIAARFIFSVYKMLIVTTYTMKPKDEQEIVDTAIGIIIKGIYK